MWPGNSAPERGADQGSSSESRSFIDMERRVSDLVNASERRTAQRLNSIEESLRAIQRGLSGVAEVARSGSGGKQPLEEESRGAAPAYALQTFALERALATSSEATGSRPGVANVPGPGMAPVAPEQSVELRMRRLGTVTVHLKYARELIKADFAGLSDPYVVVKVCGQPAQRSKTKKQTLTPEWDERLEFDTELGLALAQPMVLEVFDEDFVGVGALLKGVANRRASRADSVLQGVPGRKSLDDRALLQNNKDDKLGKLPAVSLEALQYGDDQLDFDEMRLEGVKSGVISFSVTWTEAAETDTQVRALVERDPEVRTMLKDVRKQMDTNAQKEVAAYETMKRDGRGPNSSPVKSFIPGVVGGVVGGVLKRSGTRTLPETELSEPSSVARVLRRQSSDFTPADFAALSSVAAEEDVLSATDRCGAGCRKVTHYLCGSVLHPDSRFRSAWNVGLAIFIMYCGISVPMEIAFDTDMGYAMCGRDLLREHCTNYLAWTWLNLMVDIFFILDIIINFRTGYITEGHFVDDDRLAMLNYVKGAFVLDLLGSLPINVVLMLAQPDNPYGNVVEGGGGDNFTRINRTLRMLRMMKILKLFRIRKLMTYAQNFEDFISPAVISVAKLVIVMILCCHWFGCIWWLVSEIETDIESEIEESGSGALAFPENQWRVQPWLKAADDNFGMKYAHAFLWGASMVTAMVPYDVMPVTTAENWVTSFSMFFGLVFNAIVISSLTTALTSMNSKKELAGKQLDTIRNYLYVKSVPNDLRSRILEYYEYLYTSSQALAKSVSYEMMPPNLAAQLALSINRKVAAKCALFRELSNATVVSLIAEMQPSIFVPGQLIVFEGHMLEHVYFINRGFVQMQERMVPVAVKRDNENFGLDDFAASLESGKPPHVSLTAKSVSYCDVMTLSVDRLNKAVAEDEGFQAKLRDGTLGNNNPFLFVNRKNLKAAKGFLKRVSQQISATPDSIVKPTNIGPKRVSRPEDWNLQSFNTKGSRSVSMRKQSNSKQPADPPPTTLQPVADDLQV